MGKELIKTKPIPNLDLKEPPMYRVIYLNDEVTTVEFVVETLVNIFDHSINAANALAVYIHASGSGVAAILPYEIAEQKGVEVTHLARANGYPLAIKLDPQE